MLIDEEMKPERIEFAGAGGVLFPSLRVGSFADVLTVLELIAWGLEMRPDWAVKSIAYEEGVLKVRVEQIDGEELGAEPESKS